MTRSSSSFPPSQRFPSYPLRLTPILPSCPTHSCAATTPTSSASTSNGPRPSSVAHEPVPPPAPQRLPSASSVSSSGPTAPPPVPPSPAARKSVGAPTYRIAVKDYISKEDGDLNFVAGDVIEVIGEVDENWLNGSLKGKIGIFPKKFTDPKYVRKSLFFLQHSAYVLTVYFLSN
ncbi:hypothetical protein BC829DRAFT_166255 [Chytridium lagenaria]|nr:hypothetical protein BC829DRAFT_166255 [Chytridium lagenaria]